MPRKPTDYPIGDRLPGTKYVVAKMLGAGGMGAVYEVVKEPEIRGALKIIAPKLARRPEFVKRFFEEVRLVARLRHPNIVQVFDCDTLADGTPFFVMELLDGKTLHQAFIDRRRAIPATLAYEIVRQLCEALERVHSHSPPVVHRDIKPQNIFLHRPEFGDPAVKILDFGVAAILDENHDGGFFGTLRYASPEQFRGERLTIRADIYATALVLYEMLAGRGPFDDEPDISIAQMRVEAPRLRRFAPWVPQTVDDLVAQALSKDPEKRPRSAYAFISKLFELQWVRDGSRAATDINTTAPTLTAIIDAESEGPPSGRGSDTFRGMTPPPVDGRTLECAPPEFSAHTLERMDADRQIVRVSPSGADVNAATTIDPASVRSALTRSLGEVLDHAGRAEARANDRPDTRAMTPDSHADAEMFPDAMRARPSSPRHAPSPAEGREIAASSSVSSEAGTARSVGDDSYAVVKRRRIPVALYVAVPFATVLLAVVGWYALAPSGVNTPAAAQSVTATAVIAAISATSATQPSAVPSTTASSSVSATSSVPTAAPTNPLVAGPLPMPAGIKTAFGTNASAPRPPPAAAPSAPKLPDDGRDLLFEPGRKP